MSKRNTTVTNKAATNLGWKYRIYPTPEQQVLISRNIDAQNAVYNGMLSLFKKDNFDAIVRRLKEEGLSDELIYDENGELVISDRIYMQYRDKLIEKLCNDNGIELIYKDGTRKNKETGVFEPVKYLDASALYKKLKAIDVQVYEKIKVRSYKDLYTLSEEAAEYFSERDSICLSGACQNLKNALGNFYSGRSGYPTYKHRPKMKDAPKGTLPDIRRINGTYITSNKNWKFIEIGNEEGLSEKFCYIRISKLGFVKVRMHRPIPDGWIVKPYANVRKDPDGKYYIVFHIEKENKIPTIPEEATGVKAIGIDMSLCDDKILMDSEGRSYMYGHNERIERMEAHRKQLQEQLSKKTEGSSNWIKLSARINKLTARIGRIRKYELDMLAKKIVEQYDIICTEDLNVAELKKAPKEVAEDIPISAAEKKSLRKYHPSDLVKKTKDDKGPELLHDRLEQLAKYRRKLQTFDWGRFISTLEAEAKEQGKLFQKVGRTYPSTQICHCCGHQNTGYAGLENTGKRIFTCENCGTTMDRDMNAAMNIRDEGVRLIAVAKAEAAKIQSA